MKLLHTSITVRDIDASIRFYTENLGMRLVNRHEIPENNAEIAFLEDGVTQHQIELTYWSSKREYVEGDQLDHIGFQVDDIDRVVEELRRKGVDIKKEPYNIGIGPSRIAFITDPNDIWIELIQRK
jgi:lactoylglutathione lyase